jgi:hypothetical protein
VSSLVTRSESLPEPAIRTLYVATSGNDSNPGTNASAPLRTIQQAANLSQPGDLILIQPGLYRESVSVPRSGTANQPIVFRGNGAEYLDGADETIAAGVAWTFSGNGVYSHVTGFPTDHVVTEAGRLYHYDTLPDLQALGAGAPEVSTSTAHALREVFSRAQLRHPYVADWRMAFSLDSHVRIKYGDPTYGSAAGKGSTFAMLDSWFIVGFTRSNRRECGSKGETAIGSRTMRSGIPPSSTGHGDTARGVLLRITGLHFRTRSAVEMWFVATPSTEPSTG